MLLTSLSQIENDPFRGFVTLIALSLALIFAITVHEFSHALVATTLGDPTPRRDGRLSLHPKAHLDPVGTMMIFFAGFGWGKPVVVNPSNFRNGFRTGMAATSLAGPLSNIVMAALVAIPIKSGLISTSFVGLTLFRGEPDDVLGYLLASFVFWNLLLAAFNLIPISPLDGFKVALGILPRDLANSFARTERWGPMILMLLIATEFLLPGRGILTSIITPIFNLLSFVVLGRQLL